MLETVFSVVLSIALQAGVVGLILLGVRAVLRRWLPAKWLCLLWLVLLVKLVLPFGPESALSVFNAAPQQVRQVVSAVVMAPETPVPAAEKSSSTAVQPVIHWRTAAAWVWLAGCTVLLLWFAVTRVRLARQIRRTGRCADARICRLLDDCRMRLGLPQPVTVTVQDRVSAPAIIGPVRPKILLPRYTEQLSDQAVCYMLLHELAHVKRCDLWLNALLLTLRAIFWFQPVLWLCFHWLRQDMELATDERVLQTLGSGARTAYGESLLDTLRQMSTAAPSTGMLGMVSSRHGLRERLRRIARFRRANLACTIAGMLVVTILSGVCLTSAQTLLPAPAAEILSPTLPPAAPPDPETQAEPLPASSQPEQPEQPEQQTPEPPAASETPEPPVPEQSAASTETFPEQKSETPLPEQALKPDAPSESLSTQSFDLLPGTNITVLEQYAQNEGRTPSEDGCNLADSYYTGQYVLSQENPAVSVSVAADTNGAITYVVDSSINTGFRVQLIDPETGRRIGYSHANDNSQWAESFVGLTPGKSYTLRMDRLDDLPLACTGTLIVY